jgi:hypothetical protein
MTFYQYNLNPIAVLTSNRFREPLYMQLRSWQKILLSKLRHRLQQCLLQWKFHFLRSVLTVKTLSFRRIDVYASELCARQTHNFFLSQHFFSFRQRVSTKDNRSMSNEQRSMINASGLIIGLHMFGTAHWSFLIVH